MKMGYDEALMLDTEGYVSDASGEEYFHGEKRGVKTTPLTSILPGSPEIPWIQIDHSKKDQDVEERFNKG